MPGTLDRDFIHQLRVLLVFIEFNILICILMGRQRRTPLNPAPLPAIQPPAQSQPQPAPRRRRKPPNPWVMPWICQRQENGWCRNLLTDLRHTNIPGYQNFLRMPPAFLPHQGTHSSPYEEVSHHFQKPLEVELKLAITPRHLATGETYTSLQYHWLVGHITICKFVPKSAEPSLLNYRTNTCTALIALMNGKGWRRSSVPDGMSPML